DRAFRAGTPKAGLLFRNIDHTHLAARAQVAGKPAVTDDFRVRAPETLGAPTPCKHGQRIAIDGVEPEPGSCAERLRAAERRRDARWNFVRRRFRIGLDALLLR